MNYIPDYIYKSIYEIDLNKLYASGKKVILSDLDNTIARYIEAIPTEVMIKWNKQLKALGFKIYLVSNNASDRLERFTNTFLVDGILPKAGKPNTKKMKQLLMQEGIEKDEVVAIGDQLVTDILGFNRLGVTSILVKTIDQKNQKWYTKINRLREKIILKKIKKVDCEKYNQMKALYE